MDNQQIYDDIINIYDSMMPCIQAALEEDNLFLVKKHYTKIYNDLNILFEKYYGKKCQDKEITKHIKDNCKNLIYFLEKEKIKKDFIKNIKMTEMIMKMIEQ